MADLTQEQLAPVVALEQPEFDSLDQEAVDEALKPLPDETPSEEAPKDGAQAEEDQQAATDQEDGDDTADSADEEKPKKTNRAEKRIAELTHNWRNAERRLDSLMEENARLSSLLPKEQPQESRQPAPPKQEDFDTDQEYIAAQVKFEVRQELAQEQETQRRASENKQTQDDRTRKGTAFIEKGRAEFADFDDIALPHTVTVTDTMTDILFDLDRGTEVLYHLGQNPDEAQKISRLSFAKQAKELGKIEDSLSSASEQEDKPAPKIITRAEPPPTRVKGSGSAVEKPLESLTHAEFRKRRLG